MHGAYYAVTTWLPTYLKTERNLSVLNTGSYLLVLIIFRGYLTSAYLSDRCCSGISARPCPLAKRSASWPGAYMIVVVAAQMRPETKGKTLVLRVRGKEDACRRGSAHV